MKTCCFMTNMIQTFCDTDASFYVMIPKEHGFFLRAKQNRRRSCVLRSAVSTFFLHMFYTCLNKDKGNTRFKNNKAVDEHVV